MFTAPAHLNNVITSILKQLLIVGHNHKRPAG